MSSNQKYNTYISNTKAAEEDQTQTLASMLDGGNNPTEQQNLYGNDNETFVNYRPTNLISRLNHLSQIQNNINSSIYRYKGDI